MALAPSGGGKTLAYVVPLVSLLRQRKVVEPVTSALHPMQSVHARRNGPVVLVLCSTWVSVQVRIAERRSTQCVFTSSLFSRVE